MSYRPIAERRSRSDEIVTDVSVFRRVTGKKLGDLCGRLADWKQRPEGMDVYVPDPLDPHCLRAELIKAKEIYSTRSAISPSQLLSEHVQGELRERAPALWEPMRPTKIEGMRSHKNAHAGYFLDFVLNQDMRLALRTERNQTWQALELITDAPVGTSGWKDYDPDITLAYIPPGALPDETVETITRAFSQAARGLLIQMEAVELPPAESESEY